MVRRVNYVSCAVTLLLLGSLVLLAQEGRQDTFSSVERNKLAPDLYGDTLGFQIMLVNLPGASVTGSKWQTYFEIYFVAEADFDITIQKLGRREPVPQDFSQKILLAAGSFGKSSLKEASGRIVERNSFSFRRKIPNSSKTEFAKIITFFSVKIYDAKLKKKVYKTGLLISPPFMSSGSQKVQLHKLFLSFFVSNDGELYISSRKRSKKDTSW